MVLERVIKYFGHLTSSDTGLEGIIVQGKVEDKRRKGRSSARWADQIKAQLGITLHAATVKERNRPRWRAAIRKTRAVRMWRK